MSRSQQGETLSSKQSEQTHFMNNEFKLFVMEIMDWEPGNVK